MDSTFRRLVDAVADESGADPLDPLEAVRRELPALMALPKPAVEQKLAAFWADLNELEQQAVYEEEQAARADAQARRTRRRWEKARSVTGFLEDLTRLADRRDAETREVVKNPASRSDLGTSIATEATQEKRRREAAPSGTTVDKLLDVMRRNPHMTRTPQEVYDELRSAGDSTSRTNVQTTMQRLANSGQLIERVAQGKYRLLEPRLAEIGETRQNIAAPTSDERRVWVTDEVLDRVAADAAERFLRQHPGVAEKSFLVAEGKRRISVWTERHGREPDDEGHVRRLMKTALNDLHKRQAREQQPPYLRVIGREG